jgi:hypothetical protein
MPDISALGSALGAMKRFRASVFRCASDGLFALSASELR